MEANVQPKTENVNALQALKASTVKEDVNKDSMDLLVPNNVIVSPTRSSVILLLVTVIVQMDSMEILVTVNVSQDSGAKTVPTHVNVELESLLVNLLRVSANVILVMWESTAKRVRIF